MIFNYLDYGSGYALKRAGTGMGFDVYHEFGGVWKKIGYICEKRKTKAIEILEELINGKSC